VALAKIDLPDVIAGNSAFAGDGAHEIAHLHPIARSDGHEKSCHPTCNRTRSVAIRRPRLRNRRNVLGGHASLRPLALENVK
jgi:hypothetical protein